MTALGSHSFSGAYGGFTSPMEACVTSVKMGAEGPGPPKVKRKKDLGVDEGIPEARDENRTLLQHSLFGDLHSVATFSEGTANSERRKAYTTEKGICPKFGQTEELRGDSNRRSRISEDEKKGGDFRRLIGNVSFSGEPDRSKGEMISNEQRKVCRPPPATALGPTISGG
jgi:hypothetical protein